MAAVKIPLVLSLDPYETKLIDQFAARFQVPLNADAEDDTTTSSAQDVPEVFARWLLYRKVKDNFGDIARHPAVREDWGGDTKHAFGMFLKFIHYYQFGFLYFRTSSITTNNPRLLDAFIEVDDLKDVELDISPPDRDLKYWLLLSDLFYDNEYGVADSDLPLMELLHKMRRPVVYGPDSPSDMDGTADDDSWETTEGDDDLEVEEDEAATQNDPAVGSGEDEMQEANPGVPSRPSPKPEQTGGASEPPLASTVAEDADAEMADSPLGQTTKDNEDPSNQEDEDEPFIPFSIWSLLRKCSILRRRSDNNEHILRFMEDNGFTDFYVPTPGGLFCRSEDPLLLLSGINARITHLGLAQYLGRWGVDYYVIEDPRQFLEYIPWSELSFMNSEGGQQSARAAALGSSSFGSKFDHHLFTEEEVYKYCITEDFLFPEYLRSDGMVVFELIEFGNTRFVEEISQYWEKWSDCAVTEDPETGEWYLLETRPGKKFRQIWDTADRQAALNYFRNLVDAHALGTRPLLEKELGLGYKPEYENLLRLIPFDEFRFDPKQRPMHGSRGVVYRATWAPPRRIAQPPMDSVEVVLKVIPTDETQEMDKIFQELDLNFKALQGTVINVAKLYGVTRAPEILPELPGGLHLQLAGRTFIVSECALLGKCWDYLANNLTGTLADWERILLLIWGLASGLGVLHSKGVLHRDLHWGNILVTTNKGRKELLTSVKSTQENVEILIADLGEGKVIGQTSTLGRQYGPARFRAPDIIYTGASDMYSVGMLAWDMVEAYLGAAERSGGGSQQMVPAALRDLVEKLRDGDDPSRRPTEKEAAQVLQVLWSKATHGYNFDPADLDLVDAGLGQTVTTGNGMELVVVDIPE